MNRAHASRRGRRLHTACEPLEIRRLLSTINWTNRVTTDNFGAYANVNVARAIVDRAIDDWERVISNFNYDGGGNTFSVTVTAADQGGGGRGVCNNIFRNNSTQKKPISASIQMDDNGGGSGWYFDQVPGTSGVPDDVEFDTLLTPFTADASGQSGNDFYRTIIHELGHAMGIMDDTGFFRIGDFLSNAGTDPNGGTLRALNIGGGPIEYTLTSEGGGHLWEGGNAPGYTGPAHPNDLMNAGRTVNLGLTRRQVITDTNAFLLRDVYGYTISVPSQINNLYASQNFNTGQVVVRGLQGNNSDTQVVEAFSILGITFLSFSVNGLSESFIAGGVSSIVLNGGGGTDFLRLENNFGKATTVNGGDGDDFLDFAFGNRNLSNVSGNTHVTGGSGFDQIFVYDNNVSTPQTFTVTFARFDRPGWGGFSYASDIENETLTTGTGADTVNVLSTFGGQPVVVASAGGADTVNIGNSSNGVRSINADVQIQNDPSFTNLQIFNGQDTGNRTWVIDFFGTAFGVLSGLAPANIFWDNADINAIGILCGTGVDTGHIKRLSETLQINNNGGGGDNIRVGLFEAGGMQQITQGRAGGLTIDNDPSFTDLIFDDSGDGVARTITLDVISSYNQVTGLAPATIRYDDGDVTDVEFRTGNAADTFNVLRTGSAGTTEINSSGGADAVTFGNTTNGMQGISCASLSLLDSAGGSTLRIVDTGDVVGRNMTLSATAAGFHRLTGLSAFGFIDWQSGAVGFIQPVTIISSSGIDTLRIRGTRNAIDFSGAGGVDTVTVGDTATGVADVRANITLRNPPAFNNVIIDDAAATTGRTWTVSSGGGFGSIQLDLFTAVNYLLNDTVNPVRMHLGGGDDVVRVTGLDTRNLIVNGNNGDDTVEMGAFFSNVVDPINASVGFNGNAGTDSMIFRNQGDATESGFNVVGVQIAHSDMATADHATVESLQFFGGTGGAALHGFLSTPVGTNMTITPGNSFDQINTTNNGGALAINASGGFDDVRVNHLNTAGGGLVYFNQTIQLGSLTLNQNGRVLLPGSGTTLSMKSLALDAAGQIDLYDNAMIIDYTGASPLASAQLQVQAGYAGGAWVGFGIASNIAAATPGTGIGFGEATDVFTSFPNTFAGLPVDSTALLFRYTLLGDANLDKTVNINDFARLATNFNGPPAYWAEGDFNYNFAVNVSDFALLASNFNGTLPADALERATASSASSRRLFSELEIEERV